MKRILISGGAGFIGSHLATYHLTKGDAVWVVDNLSTGRLDNLPIAHPELTFSNADLLTWDELDRAVDWADGIYHMAAIVGQKVVISHPVQVLTENMRGCERLLQAMTHHQECRLLIASTSEVYGPSGKSSFREDAQIDFPSGKCIHVTYPLSKFVDEAFALSYVEEHQLCCTIARLFNTVGSRQLGRYGMVVPRFVKRALQNDPIQVYGDGRQTRSFCDVRDSIEMLAELLFLPKVEGEIFNVGSDREISIAGLARLVKECTASSSSIEHIPYEKAYGMPFVDTMRRCPDLTKLYASISYRPKWTLEQTIEDLALYNKRV